MKQFLGRRARFPSEVCPSCSDPGVGMVLEIDDAQDAVPRWICSKCRRTEETSQSTPAEVVPVVPALHNNGGRVFEDVQRLSLDKATQKDLPVWLHIACDRCIFLGTWRRDPKTPIDCYWCPNEKYPSITSVLGRYGDIDQEYMSGNPPEAYCGGRAAHLPVADAWYLFALIRAHELGLYRLPNELESSDAEPFWAARAGWKRCPKCDYWVNSPKCQSFHAREKER